MTVIVSIFVWGLLIGGLLGPILAVPLTATIKVLLARYVWGERLREEVMETIEEVPVVAEAEAERASRSVTCGQKGQTHSAQTHSHFQRPQTPKASPKHCIHGRGDYRRRCGGCSSYRLRSGDYNSWHESRLLKRATKMLHEQKLDEAALAAHEALRIKGDSLPAFNVLAEATEKENKPETVAWRAQIARLLPKDLASQLNLVSAALRFGQLDVARKALEHVSPNDRDKAAYHVVAGWLARAQGNEADVENHFAAAVEKEPKNDLYQFNLAVIRIRSDDGEKQNSRARNVGRLTKVAEFRAGSLRALLSDAVEANDLTAADGFAQELQMSQQVTFADYLLCLELYQKLDPKKFDKLLEKVKPVAARNANDLGLLMNWMNQHRAFQRSVEVE